MAGFLKDFFTGDFSAAWADVVSAWNKLPQPVKDFVDKLGTDEGVLLQNLAGVAIQDVVAGGFTTQSFVSAGKDIVAKAAAQGKTIAISDAMAQLNILATSLKPAVVAAPAAPATAAVDPAAVPAAVPAAQ